MGPTSPPTTGRLTHRSSAEYQLDRLEPRPDSGPSSPDESFPRARLRRPAAFAAGSDDHAGRWHDRPSSLGSSSKPRRPPMFSGPPPPISASAVMSHDASSPTWPKSKHGGSPHALPSPGPPSKGSTVFGQRREPLLHQTTDSAWRGLCRRQRALEQQVQQLLDLQAAALVSGGAGGPDAGSGGHGDRYSDDGSITPTGTVYSSVTAGSRMQKSLYVPPRSTPEGNVIPVRQPVAGSPLTGLRTVRNGIRQSLTDLAALKREEAAHVDAALSDRQSASARLNGLDARRTGICDELMALESDEDEPLGKELRELGAEHDSLDGEIRRLEEQLVGMRNRRRWLHDRMENVRSKREAGLSGYHGALRDVEAELNTLLRRPPVSPLDQSILGDSKDGAEAKSTGGLEFLRLIPERRTVEMAKTWWEAEVEILERQRARIDEEQKALEEGGSTWQEVVALVTGFESGLRRIMKSLADSSAPSTAAAEDGALAKENNIRSQLPEMDKVMLELEKRMRLAESKHWNLLICAIGAELEAFREAQAVLDAIVGGAGEGVAQDAHPDDPLGAAPATEKPGEAGSGGDGGRGLNDGHEESDNEVPPDLLVSRLDGAEREAAEDPADRTTAPSRRDSENAVPPEFLAEHDDGTDIAAAMMP